MKKDNIKLMLCAGIAAVGLAACESAEQKFPDYDGGTTAYFAYQYPIRTLILGNVETYDNTSDNDGRFTIYGTCGGSYEGLNAKIDVEIDESLTDGLYFEDSTKVTPMPKDYYELSGLVLDYGGGFRGGVEVKLNDKFFNDPLAITNHYVIPVVMSENFSGVDSIIRGKVVNESTKPKRQDLVKWDPAPKDYTLFCVNYINEYTSTYLRRGADNYDKLKYKTLSKIETAKDMCIAIHTNPKESQVWDNQFWIDAAVAFAANDEYTLKMDVKATKPAKASTQVHNDPSDYKGNGIGTVSFTTDWETVTFSGKFASGQAGGHSIAFNLSELADSNDYYIDNVSFIINNEETVTNVHCDDVANPNFFTKVLKGDLGASKYEWTGKMQTDTIVWKEPDGYEKATAIRHGQFVEKDEVVYTTSKSRNQVVLPIATTEVADVNTPCKLILTFNGDDCTITSADENLCKASGTGKYVKNGAPLAWGNKDRDVLYLDYTIDFKQDNVHYATKDTLVWRDRGSAASIRTYKPIYKEN